MTVDPALDFARQSLMSYACLQWSGYEPAAHHHLIAQYLEKVARGELKRLMVFMPPRSGKSMIISEFFPAWYLGKNPDHRLVAVSHTQELAAEFGRKVRNQFNDPLYKSCFPNVKLSEDSSAADKFDLSYPNRGGYFAVGVGGALVGRGSHILLLDDLVKDADSADSESNRRKIQEWYSTVAYTRLMGDSATDDGAIVLVMQRWHPMDLAGFLLKEHKHENWAVLNFPAINDKGEALWPERYPLEKLLRIKKTLPARHWAALYQQQPYEEEGGIYKKDWWRKWPENKPAPECDFLIQSWDTAFSDADRKKSSYSSCVTLGVFKRPDDDFSQIFLVDAWKKRLEYPELRKEVQKQYREHRPDKVIIEKKASGLSLLQDLRRTDVPVSPYLPEKDKVTRAYAASSLLENGRIYYPDRRWARDFIDALVQFPTPEVDDLSDAFAQAIIWLQNAHVILHSEDAERRAREEEEEDDIYADEALPSNVRRMKPKKRRAAYG